MTDFRLQEFENPDITIELKRNLVGGGTQPLVLIGVDNIEVIVKNDPDHDNSMAATDPLIPPKFVYSMDDGQITIIDPGDGVGAKHSEILLQPVAANQTPPGHYYHQVVVHKPGSREVVDHGWWIIENV